MSLYCMRHLVNVVVLYALSSECFALYASCGVVLYASLVTVHDESCQLGGPEFRGRLPPPDAGVHELAPGGVQH